MKTPTRKRSVKLDYSRNNVLASTRHILGGLAYWMSLLLDAGAMKRLGGKGANLNWIHWDSHVFDLRKSNSYGENIENSAVLQAVSLIQSFVETGNWPGSVEQLEAALTTLVPLSHVLQSNMFLDVMEEPVIDPEACQIVHDVIEIARTRMSLYQGRSVDLPHLAKVAGLTEKTLRMAATQKPSGAQDLRTTKNGRNTVVVADDANKWLARRPDYKRTRIGSNLSAEKVVPKTALELATLLQGLRAAAKLTQEEVTKELKLKGKYRSSYEDLEGGWWDCNNIDVSLFDVNGIQQLASILKVKNVQAFVRGVAEFMSPYRLDRVLAKQSSRPTVIGTRQ